MHHNACPDDPEVLNRLRTWAWERGRTDVVLDLDLHAGAWAFQQTPSRANLVRLADDLNEMATEGAAGR